MGQERTYLIMEIIIILIGVCILICLIIWVRKSQLKSIAKTDTSCDQLQHWIGQQQDIIIAKQNEIDALKREISKLSLIVEKELKLDSEVKP